MAMVVLPKSRLGHYCVKLVLAMLEKKITKDDFWYQLEELKGAMGNQLTLPLIASEKLLCVANGNRGRLKEN